MGLFDVFKSRPASISTAKEALLAAMLDAVAADGVLEESEAACLINIVRGDVDAFKSAHAFWRRAPDAEVRTRVAQILDRRQRLCLLVNMIDSSMSDGHLAKEEESVIVAYMHAFEISEAELRPAIEVIALKNSAGVLF